MNYLVSIVVITLTFQSQISLAEKFVPGYYYTKEGKRIDGLIKFNRATFSAFGSKPSNIKFKTNSEAKPVKFTADDIQAFVIGTDSFAIIRNFKINSISGDYVRDFAQVMVTGRLKLFVHKSASSDGQFNYDHDKFVLWDEKNGYLGIWNSNKQREEMAKYFSGRTDLVEKILNKKDETPIPDLVRDFNMTASQ
jgi:hypothetical protein